MCVLNILGYIDILMKLIGIAVIIYIQISVFHSHKDKHKHIVMSQLIICVLLQFIHEINAASQGYI